MASLANTFIVLVALAQISKSFYVIFQLFRRGKSRVLFVCAPKCEHMTSRRLADDASRALRSGAADLAPDLLATDRIRVTSDASSAQIHLRRRAAARCDPVARCAVNLASVEAESRVLKAAARRSPPLEPGLACAGQLGRPDT